MARIRTIKPDFWRHPVIGKMSDATKLLAIALLNMADDEGYFQADPAMVRNECRPYDPECSTTTVGLRELSGIGYVEVREHSSHGPIGRVVKFTDHQVINKPTKSKLSLYFNESHGLPEDYGRTTVGLPSGSGSGSGSGKEITPLPPASGGSEPSLKPKRKSRREEFPVEAHEILADYEEKIRKDTSKSGPGIKNITRRLAEGYTRRVLLDCVFLYGQECAAQGTEVGYRMVVSNFFGEKAGFLGFVPGAKELPPAEVANG